MAQIVDLVGRCVWDSRGKSTVEAELRLDDGARGRAIAPAGASTGAGEAKSIATQDAVHAINTEIRAALAGMDCNAQADVDARLVALDGTPDKSRLGGNALVAVSLACAHAAAASARLPLWKHLAGARNVALPVPQIQIYGGGAHARGRVDVQDYLLVCPGAGSFAEALEWTAQVYHAAGARLAKRGQLQGVADEGGYWPSFKTNEEGLAELVGAIEDAGLEPGRDAAIALDIAASQFHRAGRYQLALERRSLSADQLHVMLGRWLDRYPIVSIEDPFAETDDEAMTAFTRAFGKRVQIIGDDFLVTNAARVEQAAKLGACNAVLVKPNQAGTLTEAKAALDVGKRLGWGTIVSARSGETEDMTIAHLSVGWRSGQLKVGSFARSERMAKWNEVLRIEESVGKRARYAGRDALPVKLAP